MKLQKLLV